MFYDSESLDHLFGSCKFVKLIIDHISGIFGFDSMFMQVMRHRNIWRFTWVTFLWMIWSARNKIIHEEEGRGGEFYFATVDLC